MIDTSAQHVPNRNAQVIIPLAIIAWIGGILVATVGVPPVVGAVFVVAFTVAVPVVVFYLIGEAGWRRLAKDHRATNPHHGEWQLCATGQMAVVSVHHPQFHRVKMRFIGGSLRVAATPEALHLSTMLTKVPVLGPMFPELRVPWNAISRAHEFDAPGWFTPNSQPGLVVQVGYDPNYTGRFVELEVGEPAVFIQLPATMLGEGLERLGLGP